MATVFSDIYGTNGLGAIVNDIGSGSVTNRKVASNDAYVQLASIKGYWRKRSYDYTSGSTVPLVDGTYQYSVPTATGSAYESPYRLYYPWNGRPKTVRILNDDQWLALAKISSSDKGFPEIARIVQTSSAKNLELSPRMSSAFMSQIGTLTLEYFITIERLSGDTDEPIIPENYRHHIKYLAAKLFALSQGDTELTSMLVANGVMSLAEKGLAELRRHDLTRTGQSQGLRPRTSYVAISGGNDAGRSSDYE